MRDEKDRPDGPCFQVVVQNEKVRGSVFEDGALHFRIGGINDSGPKGFRLAFQLERRLAGRAEVIDSDGISRCDVKPWRFARGAEEICSTPRFGPDASALRSTLVLSESGGRETQVHAEIRSRLIRTNKDAITLKRKAEACGCYTVGGI